DQAEKALEAKKYEEAILGAKRALQLDGNNVKAVSIMAQIAKHASPADALRWEQKLAELQPSSNTWLDVAETAVAARDVKTGWDALSKVADADKNLRYYRAAAGLSMLKNDRKGAIEAYQKALQQPGADARDRYNLAALNLTSGDETSVNAALSELEKLCVEPETSLQANRTLATYYTGAKRYDLASPHVQFLLSLSKVDLQDVLTALDFFSAVAPPRYGELLRSCVERFKGEPRPIAELISWLNAHAKYNDAKTIPGQVAENVSKDPLYRAAICQTYLNLRDWKTLQSLTDDGDWAANDYLRIAFNLKARREQNAIADSEVDEQWKIALAKAQSYPNALIVLYRLATGWNWKPLAENALWAAAGNPSVQKDALLNLWKLYGSEKNSSGLFRVANRLVEIDSSDAGAKINAVILGALLGVDNKTYREWAQANWEQYKDKHPEYGTTYAYILYQQGKVDEAQAVLMQMKQADFENPSDALYAGIIKQAAGEKDEAQRLLSIAEKGKGDLLPEEKGLLERAEATLKN
ncbi:MAG: hypothetical protein JO331_16445, partial [Verrucomicrobia bacterium]|nr:hypothetical protein [Verrucomicrobiota bacterium]